MSKACCLNLALLSIVFDTLTFIPPSVLVLSKSLPTLSSAIRSLKIKKLLLHNYSQNLCKFSSWFVFTILDIFPETNYTATNCKQYPKPTHFISL